MARTVYIRTSFTGGTADSLDYIDGASLADGEVAFVIYENRWYSFILDSDSGLTEDSPWIVKPDTNASTKRWILQAPAIVTRTVQGDPSYTTEGIFVINTLNNNFKVYADGEWRTLKEWAASESASPSASPSISPSGSPSISPSSSPSASPSISPSGSPSVSPSLSPSASPSESPSKSPSESPSVSPSNSPS